MRSRVSFAKLQMPPASSSVRVDLTFACVIMERCILVLPRTPCLHFPLGPGGKPVPSSSKHLLSSHRAAPPTEVHTGRTLTARANHCESEHTPGALAISPAHVELKVACMRNLEGGEQSGL